MKAPHIVRPRVPRISIDYGFLGQVSHDSAVLLVTKEIQTGTTMPMLVPKKGFSEDWVPARISAFVGSFGYKQVITRSDSEPFILALTRAVVKLREEQMLEEDSIKGDYRRTCKDT